MSEAEWIDCESPFPMLRFLHCRNVSARKYRLFGAACCGRAWPVMADARARDAAAALVRFADGPGGEVDKKELEGAWGVSRAAVTTSRGAAGLGFAARCVIAA